MNHLLSNKEYRRSIFRLIRNQSSVPLLSRNFFAAVNHHHTGDVVNFCLWEFNRGKFELHPLNKCLGDGKLVQRDRELLEVTLSIWEEEKMPEILMIFRDGIPGQDFTQCCLPLQHMSINLQLFGLVDLIVYEGRSVIFFGPTF